MKISLEDDVQVVANRNRTPDKRRYTKGGIQKEVYRRRYTKGGIQKEVYKRRYTKGGIQK
jgi:uncharacterized membrane protein